LEADEGRIAAIGASTIFQGKPTFSKAKPLFNGRYAVDMEGYGALEFLTEEKLVVHPC
jgi:hypothetical protein